VGAAKLQPLCAGMITKNRLERGIDHSAEPHKGLISMRKALSKHNKKAKNKWI